MEKGCRARGTKTVPTYRASKHAGPSKDKKGDHGFKRGFRQGISKTTGRGDRKKLDRAGDPGRRNPKRDNSK